MKSRSSREKDKKSPQPQRNANQRAGCSARSAVSTNATKQAKEKRIHEVKMHSDFGLYLNASDSKSLNVCPPFKAKGYVVNPDGSEPACLISFTSRVNTVVNIDIPLALLKEPEKLVKLLIDRGFPIELDNMAAKGKLIAYYVQQNCQADITCVRAKADGWMPLPDGTKVYVFGNSVLGKQSGAYKAIRLPALPMAPTLKGRRDAWHALQKLLRREPIVVLSVCAALSAPLLEPLNLGTQMLFLVGKSSIGKTVILKLVASIFSEAHNMFTWQGTDNGIEANALRYRDLPFIVDEVDQAKAAQFAALSYRLTNAGSQQRANSRGEAVAVQATRTVILASGETDPIAKIEQQGLPIKQGQTARLVSVHAEMSHGVWDCLGDFSSGKEKSDYVLSQLSEVQNIAGKQFIKTIADDVDVHQQHFQAIASDLEQEICTVALPDDDGVPGRVLKNFALFAFTGLLAAKCDIVPWDERDVLDAIKLGYSRWFNAYMERKPKTTQDLVAPVRLFLESQRGSKFKPFDTWRDDHQGTVAGFDYRKRNGQRYFIFFPAYFEAAFCSELPKKAVLGALKQAGYLMPASDGTPTVQIQLPGAGKGQKRAFYAIRESILMG
jgi:putative DNA primase/helicase